jgi:ParB family chromosome partitioning protein
MENVVREDLNAVDRAAALRTLKAQLGDAPWEQVAEAVGIRRSRLFQLLGTEKLPEAIQEDIRAGRLSEKQSRALQGLPPAQQLALRDAIVGEEIPADEAIRLARALRAARIPDDLAAATAALAEIRAGGTHSAGPSVVPEDETAALLSAVAAAAGGGRAERTALARIADAYAVPAYDAERLRGEVLALARSLARTPAGDLQPGTPVHGSLLALYGALDSVLS